MGPPESYDILLSEDFFKECVRSVSQSVSQSASQSVSQSASLLFETGDLYVLPRLAVIHLRKIYSLAQFITAIPDDRK